MSTLHQFTGKYPVAKTICFDLKAQGQTLYWINKSKILEEDTHRAESYKQVKSIIDDYHRHYIDMMLSTFKLKVESNNCKDSLEEYFMLYHQHSKDERVKKTFDNVHKALRKQIADVLTKNDKYKRIDKKELIEQDLLAFVDTDDKRELVKEFNGFATYFSGFHENRKNMYSAEEKSTSIAYRLINENLPKFIDNIDIFAYAKNANICNLDDLYHIYESELTVDSIDDMFCLGYYNVVLTQKQIDIYNTIIGGNTLEDGTKIQGLNEYINLYNQQQTDKNKRIPKLKTLFKQILSDKESLSFKIDSFSNSNEVLKAINDTYTTLLDKVFECNNKGERSLPQLLQSIDEYDLSKIFICNDTQLTEISQRLFGSWDIIGKCIEEDYKVANPQKARETNEKYQQRLDKYFKSLKHISIAHINSCLKAKGYEKTIQQYFASLGESNKDNKHTDNYIKQIKEAYLLTMPLLTSTYPQDKSLAQDKDAIHQIKTLLDSIKAFQRFIKPLILTSDEDKDDKFYSELALLWEVLDCITPLYNMVRNYATRKPYTTEKIKINFQNQLLLKGWDVNKETDNASVILRKDGMYYLAIMNKKFRTLFKSSDLPSDGICYEKMEYKLLPGANKMLPKVFFSKSRIDEFQPSREILDNYARGTHKKGDTFSLTDCHNLIDFFKQSIEKHEDWSKFDFKFSDTSSYEDISGFYREVEEQGYKVTFRNISASYIDQLVNEGKLYLFQIYNKDFSPYSKGTPNMHTLYWKMLFDPANLKDVVYKLNGEAEVFFRKSSIKVKRPTHPANQPIANKNPLNSKSHSTFDYDLIKDKRYTVDKFQLHVPITLNFKSQGSDNINIPVREYIRDANDLHFIGIDRGERHLLYVCVIDSRGNIKEQFSLNDISNEYKGNTYHTDYHAILSERDRQRLEARQSWKAIENIKELKQGYLSQVVHKISTLMVKYNAIVVLEDLNMGFKRGRQKVESNVYQQFEKALIDKLSYLVDKRKDANEDGGLLHAYQLASSFTTFKDISLRKQSGFLFYIPAWNTSKMDPVTGFVNMLDTRYESIDSAKVFINKFEDISYDIDKDVFLFKFDYSKYTQKAEGSQTVWTISTHGTRVDTFRNPDRNNEWESKEINLTQEFKACFTEYGIDIDEDLKSQILALDKKNFYEGLMHLLRLTLQMRNSMIGTDIDYILSPVADSDGRYYDSRTCGDQLPANADANGAYNIARKGLWLARQIRESEDISKVKLAISNKEWLQFAQQKPYLND